MTRNFPILLILSAAFPLTAAPAAADQSDAGQVLVAQNDPQTAKEPLTPAQNDGLLDRAMRAVEDAGREVSDAATAAGRSAADYLSDNPDLNRQVLDFGRDLGVPGFNKDGGAQLTVICAEAGELQVSAYGLPAEREVTLGWLDNERFRELGTLTADARGRVETKVDAPPTLAGEDAVVFALETQDRRLRLASDPVQPM